VGIDEVNKFNILNIELSIPINYYHKSFIFSFIPHLAFPQSSTITTEDAVIKKTLRKYFTGQQELVIGLILEKKNNDTY
jgi:hypothetical protein